ncbi:MAG: hypothetical protein M3N29_01570 [Chloroflexota bacterium]|nr:hypothetical protein [Chloroflexota bacterium]
MLDRGDEAALLSDAYIDSLLAGHARRVTPVDGALPARDVRLAIELLERGLPRFHPSFLFEELLAARLRGTAELPQPADIVRLAPAAERPFVGSRFDRRVLLGGAAIASGVSMAAVYAWRHAGRRAATAAR